ncbi:hypothetical protein [Labrys neptuniae]
MKAKLFLVFCVAATSSGCGGLATPEGMASTEPLLWGESTATKAAYRDWVRCGRESMNRQLNDSDQPYIAMSFSDPVAERAAAACKPQENLVMAQINLDDFHKSWLRRSYQQDLSFYAQLHHFGFGKPGAKRVHA